VNDDVQWTVSDFRCHDIMRASLTTVAEFIGGCRKERAMHQHALEKRYLRQTHQAGGIGVAILRSINCMFSTSNSPSCRASNAVLVNERVAHCAKVVLILMRKGGGRDSDLPPWRGYWATAISGDG
jgi:hypothetical protein